LPPLSLEEVVARFLSCYSSYVAYSALTLPKVTEALTNIDKELTRNCNRFTVFDRFILARGASVPFLAKILAANPVAGVSLEVKISMRKKLRGLQGPRRL
jgi:hypothetical protein